MLARGVRNVIYNYTDAQRKVRAATSNDAWGPPPALMHEIADLTDNMVAYAEVMPIIWKRLNDHGKNWRHVYKSLVLLDHLIKYGNERVSQQCKENIFAIQTLKDFQYVEDQKDQGYNVREKAKQLVALLKDDERLRNERRKAQEARERYVRQAMGMDSHGSVSYGRTTTSVRRNSLEGSDTYGGASYLSGNHTSQNRSTSYNDGLHAAASKDFGQPANQEEEQLQMQIALAESQREAEDEERRRRNDELKLKIALERSVNEASPNANSSQLFDFNTTSQYPDPTYYNTSSPLPYQPETTTSNLGWDADVNRSSTHAGYATTSNDPWSLESALHPSTTPKTSNGPWQPTTNASLSMNTSDPWGLLSTTTTQPVSTTTIDNELSDFFGASATISSPSYNQQPQQSAASSNPWNITPTVNTNPTSPIYTNLSLANNNNGGLLYPTIAGANNSNAISSSPTSSSLLSTSRKTPESFLGDKFTNLVNLDQLVTDTKSTNPFGPNATRTQNPFTNATRPPTLEQLSSSNNMAFTTSGSTLPPPLVPSSYNNTNANTQSFNTTNPFL
ncbi:unnamed protein product [Adineta ricciae]|uniref:ENTH domain-containing protein n=1 Tax=Adineta ricciae TaxID=249248 RepID=A0A816FC19_ADIRI|nr:unnamed protein product [Adineta ricciae]